MKKIIFTLLFLLLTPLSVNAEEQPQAMIVFDASGSMWGKINGEAKIGIAKQALNKVLVDWNEDLHLGLMAYGHRKKGDCNDIQTLVPIGELNKKAMISKVKAIKPKGKTPISLSLKKAAEELRYTEEKATIILISDGKETCDADPCATAKALNGEGIDFITHVIGFDVDKQTDEQLKCIADSTGGEYFSAKNASSLNEAMGKIAQTVQKKEVKKPEAPVVKKLKKNLEITASEKEKGKWIQASHSIYKNDDGERGDYVTNCSSYKQKACFKKIPVGKYLIESSYHKLKVKTPLEITTGEVAKLHIVMGQTGKVEITASEKEKGKWIQASHSIYKNDEGERGDHMASCSSTKAKACVKQIPVGQYTIESSYHKLKVKTPLEITTGDVAKRHIVMGQTGKVEITASEKAQGKWIKAYHSIYKNDEGERGDYVASCSSSKPKACVKQIPVGQYIIQSKSNLKKFKKDTMIEIKSAETTKTHIIFVQFQIVSNCSDKSADINHEVYASNGRMVYAKQAKCSDVFQVGIDKGDYTLESTLNNQTKTTKFSVGADHPSQITIDMQNINKEPSHQDLIDADKKGQSSIKTKEEATSQQEPQVKKMPIDNEKLTKGLADLGKQMEMMSKQNPSITDRKIIDENGNVDLPSVDEVQGAMRQAGALLNGLRSLGKGLEKEPLQGMKEAMRASLPKYQASVECYQNADDLDSVKQCEVLEKELVELARDKFQLVTGFKTDKVIKIKPHSEWNDEIKKQTVTKKQNELKEIKLTVQCFDQGAGFLEVQDCIKNDGKYTAKKSEFEQLGNFLNAFGGMAK